MTARLDEWRIRKRDTEEWMRHRQLPQNLQERVRRFVQYKWLATRGVDEEAILLSLPLDLRREIQHHLCLSLVRRVCFSLSFFCLNLLVYQEITLLNFVIGCELKLNSHTIILYRCHSSHKWMINYLMQSANALYHH